MIGFRGSARAHGPVFDGRANRVMDRAADQSERDIANSAADFIRRDAIVVPRHPTGRYRRHIKVRRVGRSHEVTDSGIVYGRWLEGTSQRNAETRFKGYAFFRRATQRYARAAGGIADRVVGRHIREIN